MASPSQTPQDYLHGSKILHTQRIEVPVGFSTVAELGHDAATLVFEHGWQSWSPSGWYRLGANPPRPTAPNHHVMAYRPGVRPAGSRAKDCSRCSPVTRSWWRARPHPTRTVDPLRGAGRSAGDLRRRRGRTGADGNRSQRGPGRLGPGLRHPERGRPRSTGVRSFLVQLVRVLGQGDRAGRDGRGPPVRGARPERRPGAARRGVPGGDRRLADATRGLRLHGPAGVRHPLGRPAGRDLGGSVPGRQQERDGPAASRVAGPRHHRRVRTGARSNWCWT